MFGTAGNGNETFFAGIMEIKVDMDMVDLVDDVDHVNGVDSAVPCPAGPFGNSTVRGNAFSAIGREDIFVLKNPL